MPPSRSGRRLLVAAIVLAVPLALAGCSAASRGQASPSPTAAVPAPTSARARGTAGMPGVSGEIAAIQAGTLQVQGSGQQTAVSYSGATAITQTVTGSLSDVAVGECVTAITAPGGAATKSGKTGSAATTVTIQKASAGGDCTGGFGGFAGSDGQGRFSGMRPTGFPIPAGAGRPTFRPGSGRQGGFTPPVSGLVTAVGSATITVKATPLPGRSTSTDGPSTKMVEVNAKTTYRRTGPTTSAALKVGLCVVASGTTASNGAVAATSLRLSPKNADGCSAFGAGAGFSRGGFGGVGRTGGSASHD